MTRQVRAPLDVHAVIAEFCEMALPLFEAAQLERQRASRGSGWSGVSVRRRPRSDGSAPRRPLQHDAPGIPAAGRVSRTHSGQLATGLLPAHRRRNVRSESEHAASPAGSVIAARTAPSTPSGASRISACAAGQRHDAGAQRGGELARPGLAASSGRAQPRTNVGRAGDAAPPLPGRRDSGRRPRSR